MKSTDLRIGNWVYKFTVHAYPVASTYEPIKVDINTLGLVDEYNAWYQPIPLTPELLEKAGFIDISGDQVYAKMNLGNITFAWHIRLKTIEWASVDDVSITHITALHQLQNLFHALTGEELKIEL